MLGMWTAASVKLVDGPRGVVTGSSDNMSSPAVDVKMRQENSMGLSVTLE